jgi:hypothetical protein
MMRYQMIVVNASTTRHLAETTPIRSTVALSTLRRSLRALITSERDLSASDDCFWAESNRLSTSLLRCSARTARSSLRTARVRTCSTAADANALAAAS